MDKNMSVAVHAIRNFVYFTRNYPDPKGMCEEIWGKGVNGDHFYNKLKGYDFDMVRFFIELSLHNQTKFAEWVTKNYDCGWNKYDKLDETDGGKTICILFGEMAASFYAYGGIDELLEHIDDDVFDIKKHHFRDEREKIMYLNGVEEGQGWQGCIEITEEDCEKLENLI